MSSVTILYHPNSEQDRSVRELLYNYKRQTGRELGKVSLETIEGAEMARLYGAVQYPAVIAKDNNGRLLRMWEGEYLPLISELSYYDQAV